MELSHSHHYVPQWYQRRFLPAGQKKFNYYFDLNPEVILRADGRKHTRNAKLPWGPPSCFEATDLYMTQVGGPSDHLEKYLFGRIEGLGQRGVPVVANDTWEDEGPDSVSDFIEFLDAQKLRTPNGLDWISYAISLLSRANPKKYEQLEKSFSKSDIILSHLVNFQRLNTTIWTEAVWEVVSACKSDVKFIISDHPVTAYNPKCFPLSQYCRYQHDPSIELIGTRTIFPLDLNHLLIITNREYADKPGKRALKSRTNARYFQRPTPFFIPGIIREREFTDREVATINFIIKTRARRYIASAEPEWLHPENTIPTEHWSKLDALLLPPQKQQYSSEQIYFGNEQSITGMDAFGRPLSPETTRQEVARIKVMIERIRSNAQNAAPEA